MGDRAHRGTTTRTPRMWRKTRMPSTIGSFLARTVLKIKAIRPTASARRVLITYQAFVPINGIG